MSKKKPCPVPLSQGIKVGIKAGISGAKVAAPLLKAGLPSSAIIAGMGWGHHTYRTGMKKLENDC